MPQLEWNGAGEGLAGRPIRDGGRSRVVLFRQDCVHTNLGKPGKRTQTPPAKLTCAPQTGERAISPALGLPLRCDRDQLAGNSIDHSVEDSMKGSPNHTHKK